MKYFVTVDGETLEVELTARGARVGEEEWDAEIATDPGGRLRHLRIGPTGLRLQAERSGDGWLVRVGGRRLSVEVEDERSRAIRELAGEPEPAGGAQELRAPMPGLVVRIEVEVGGAVKDGDGLVIMEAMKMENELTAARPGTVTEIHVEEGETVDRDDLLVTLE